MNILVYTRVCGEVAGKIFIFFRPVFNLIRHYRAARFPPGAKKTRTRAAARRV